MHNESAQLVRGAIQVERNMAATVKIGPTELNPTLYPQFFLDQLDANPQFQAYALQPGTSMLDRVKRVNFPTLPIDMYRALEGFLKKETKLEFLQKEATSDSTVTITQDDKPYVLPPNPIETASPDSFEEALTQVNSDLEACRAWLATYKTDAELVGYFSVGITLAALGFMHMNAGASIPPEVFARYIAGMTGATVAGLLGEKDKQSLLINAINGFTVGAGITQLNQAAPDILSTGVPLPRSIDAKVVESALPNGLVGIPTPSTALFQKAGRSIGRMFQAKSPKSSLDNS